MALFIIPIWKKAPFLRVLLPFITGILVQEGSNNPQWISWLVGLLSVAGIAVFSFLPAKLQFAWYFINGVHINALLFATGGLLTATQNTHPAIDKVERFKNEASLYVATISEPLSEKKASWKGLAEISYIQFGEEKICPSTKIILYFRKDTTLHLKHGSRIVFRKKPERVANFDSAFDYRRYCALRNIHFRIFLTQNDFVALPHNYASAFSTFIFNIRRWVIDILKENIPGKDECALALALLIGYKDELDKDLVQSYSNTGVVHVIAISGLHLGLIYSILMLVCTPLKQLRGGKMISFIIVIPALWVFTFLAGASPPVLRSAVMFTFIVCGTLIGKQTSIFNSLAASAFFLLCADAMWLWDAGFILSYAALLSIAVYNKRLYCLHVSENKIVDAIWKLNVVTLSAQILTMPVIIYYFHQFPLLFLLSNFIAVPLSGLILSGELLLCAIYFSGDLAAGLGRLIAVLIKLMNHIIVYIDRIEFAAVKNLEITLLQLILFYVLIAAASIWLIDRQKQNL